MTAPKNMAEYQQWLLQALGVAITPKTRAIYDEIASVVNRAFDSSQYWRDLVGQFAFFRQEYRLKTDYDLFMGANPPDFLIKPYESFLVKTFRKNILDNRNWPEHPKDGWFDPNVCHHRINDLVRTTVVAKYLDGVRFFSEKAAEIATRMNLRSRVYYEARPEGYYAAHMYLYPIVEIPTGAGTEQREFSIEVQITTQLKEVMRQLTHKQYERRRETDRSTRDEKWQWNHQSNEFVPNYLGHMLHYLEGMIMQVRDKQEKPHETGV